MSTESNQNSKKHNLKITGKTLAIGLGVVAVGAIGGVLFLRGAKDHQDDVSVSEIIVPSAHAEEIAKHSTQYKRAVITFASIDSSAFSDAQKKQIKGYLQNIKTYGSRQGRLTTEFKKATHAKMSYRFGRKQKLAFVMADIKNKLPTGFVLTGREYDGVAGSDGFLGVYRLYENPKTKAKFEIIETKITHDKPLVLAKELFTQNINGTPFLLEQFNDKNGERYYHGEFAINDRYVQISSRNMNLPEFMQLVETVWASASATK